MPSTLYCMYNAVVNDNETFSFDPNALPWDVVPTANGGYHVLYRGQSFDITMLKAAPSEKSYRVRINGRVYQVSVQDEMDQLMQKLGLDKMAAPKINQIKAPMPGLVLNLFVEPGQEVRKGEPVVILEAMKMENIIKAPGDAQIKAVVVQKGQAVDKNQVLIELV